MAHRTWSSARLRGETAHRITTSWTTRSSCSRSPFPRTLPRAPGTRSSWLKVCRLKNGKRFIATVEPFHGNFVVAYTEGQDPKGLWKRTVVDEQIKWGHAVWCADLDGDGSDEFVLGFRDPLPTSRGPGVNVYRASASAAGDAITWEKHVIDDKG